jgi:hypothetical protein
MKFSISENRWARREVAGADENWKNRIVNSRGCQSAKGKHYLAIS